MTPRRRLERGPETLSAATGYATVFRAKYLDALRQLYAEHALRFTEATLVLEAEAAFDTFVKRLRRQK